MLCKSHKTYICNLLSVASEATLLIWKSFLRSWYCTSPPPSLVERGWWTKGPPLTAVRLASTGLFPKSLSSSGEWSIRPNWQWAPSQTEKTTFEPIIIVLYCTPGRTLINSPPRLRENKWITDLQRNILLYYIVIYNAIILISHYMDLSTGLFTCMFHSIPVISKNLVFL